MTSESAFIDMLRALATDPAARGLADDAAVLEVGGAQLVITSDTIVAGVHFLADDPPERSEEHTSELQSLMRSSYAVFCLKKKTHEKSNNAGLHNIITPT